MAKATLNTNSSARKAQAHKSGKCQVCGEKTDGYSVKIDYDKGKVIKSRKGKAEAGRAFYCEVHANKKVKRLEWKLRQRNGETPKRKPAAKKSAKATTAKKRATKKATTRKATKASAAKPKRATTKKATAKKATTKRTAKPAAKAKATKTAKPRKKVVKRTAKKASASSAADPF